MAGVAAEGSQFDDRRYDSKMTEVWVFYIYWYNTLLRFMVLLTSVVFHAWVGLLFCRLGEGDEFFTSYDEVHDSFDAMGLQENLLRGIYAYGNCRRCFST